MQCRQVILHGLVEPLTDTIRLRVTGFGPGVVDVLNRGNNFLRSALGPHNWGYVATVTPQQPDPIPIPRGKVIGDAGESCPELVEGPTPPHTQDMTKSSNSGTLLVKRFF